MKLHQALALLWATSRAEAVIGDACTLTAVTVQLQPYKIICSGVTTESTRTRTFHNCETAPSDVITTVTAPCTATSSCTPVTVMPPVGCTHPCTTTVTSYYPPGTITPPDVTITTEGTCAATTSCTPVTVPPPADCAHPCTTTVYTFPPSTTTTPPPDITITTEGTCTATSSCTPTTVPPQADCTHPCTTTVYTYPEATPTSTPISSSSTTTTSTTTTTTPTSTPVSSSSTTTTSTTTTTTPTSTPVSSSSTMTTSTTTTTTPGPTFSCDPYGYLIQVQALYRVNISSGETTLVRKNVGPAGEVNAMGYNVNDNYLYAIARNGTGNILLRIAGDGSSTVVPSNIPPSNFNYFAGDFTTDGMMWITSGGGVWAKIDLSDPSSATYGKIVDSGDSSQSLRATDSELVYDWVSLSSHPGYLYAVTSATNQHPNTQLLKWDLSTHEWSLIKNYGVVQDARTLAAAYTTSGQTFYAVSNESGKVFAFNVGDPDTTPRVVSTAPTSSRNDGARCQLAPEVSTPNGNPT